MSQQEDTQDLGGVARRAVVRAHNQKDVLGMSAAMESFRQACVGAVPAFQDAVRAATPHTTLLGRTCGHCGAIDCRREHTITVSLPTAPAQDKPVLEETRADYWTLCPSCRLVKAYCKC